MATPTSNQTNGHTESRCVVVIGDPADSIALALILRRYNGAWHVVREVGVPRLFYPLPLVGTEGLALPFAVVSARFEPTEPRNGILASANVEGSPPTAENWKLLSAVPTLFKRLVAEAAEKAWEEAHVLSSITLPATRDWLDEHKFKDAVLVPLIEYLRSRNGPELVQTIGGKRAAIGELLVPVVDNAQTLHGLAARFSPLRERLPAERIVSDLSQIVTTWATLLGIPADQLSGSLTFESLGGEAASRCTALTQLDAIILPQEHPERGIEWLNDLFEQLSAQRLDPFLRTCALVPDQRGRLRHIADVRMDGAIDEELKNISAEMGDDIRAELLDTRVSDRVKAQFSSIKGREFTNEDCLERALKGVNQHARNDDRDYVLANAKLLRWLIDHERIDKITGYIVYAAEGIKPLTADDPVLLPEALWDESSRAFCDVFGPDRRLDDGYALGFVDSHWAALQSLGVLKKSVLSTEELNQLDELQIEDAASDDIEHKPETPVSVAQVLFLPGDKGVLTQLRKSKAKARRFLEFLLKYVIKAEPSWRDGIKG